MTYMTMIDRVRPGGPSVAASAQEEALMQHLIDLGREKCAWFDTVSTVSGRRHLFGGGVSDLPAKFKMWERAGGRVLTPARTWYKHPILMSLAGRTPLLLGAGGSGQNVLAANGPNGALIFEPDLRDGAEVNNVPILVPGQGLSASFKFQCPVPNTTLNGIAFGASSGGCFIGSVAETAADAMNFFVDGGNGRINFQSRKGTGGNVISPAGVDYRDGLIHTVSVSVDFTIPQAARLWIDGVETGTRNAGLPDFAATAGADKLQLGAAAAVAENRFVGFIYGGVVKPTGINSTTGKRQIDLDWLATK